MTFRDWALIIALASASLGTLLASLARLFERLGRQDAQLEWQSRMLEMQALERGTIPPAREKLTTLAGEKVRALPPMRP